MARAPQIAVVGAGTGAIPQQLEVAEDVGAALAAAGAVVVTGGLGGVMEAAGRGARSMRGPVLGILPGDRIDDANGWVTVAVATGMGELRNGLVVRAADAVIAVGGGLGTLSEIALALKAGKVVVGLGAPDVDGIAAAADAQDAATQALAGAEAARRRAA